MEKLKTPFEADKVFNNSGDMNSGHNNSGNWNSGNWNSGHRNSGHRNSGDNNSGHRNSGDSNSGRMNSGHRNSGNWNSGHRNSGHRNSGDWNSGGWNSGDMNSGVLNTNKPDKYRVFNKWISAEEFNNIEFPNFFYFDLTQGFFKIIDYKKAWQLSYKKASKEDREKVKKIPGFDKDLFYKITGIEV